MLEVRLFLLAQDLPGWLYSIVQGLPRPFEGAQENFAVDQAMIASYEVHHSVRRAHLLG